MKEYTAKIQNANIQVSLWANTDSTSFTALWFFLSFLLAAASALLASSISLVGFGITKYSATKMTTDIAMLATTVALIPMSPSPAYWNATIIREDSMTLKIPMQVSFKPYALPCSLSGHIIRMILICVGKLNIKDAIAKPIHIATHHT